MSRRLLMLSVLSLSAVGCEQINRMTGPSRAELVEMTFDANDPDRRREGICKLSSRGDIPEADREGYALLLRTDPDPVVRSCAARALGKAGDPRYAKDLMAALDAPGQDDAVRWDAAEALATVVDPNAAEPLARHARRDPSRDVRISCMRSLRSYPTVATNRALVECLSDRQFAVRHEARKALTALNGQDLGPQPADWAAVTEDGYVFPQPKRSFWDRVLGR